MADLGALPAVDALVVAHPLDIHLAHAHARAAVVAQVLVHPDGQQGQAAEQGVDGPQGAQKAAECPVHEDAQRQNGHAQQGLPAEQHSGQGPVLRAQGQQGEAALQRPGGADVLAEGGHRQALGESVPNGQRHHKQGQDDVFQPAQPAGPLAFFNFWGGNFVQQLLNQPEGAQKPAHHPAQDNAREQKKSGDVQRQLVGQIAQGVL